MNRTSRVLLIALACIGLAWLAGWGGYALARSAKMTPEKVRQYMNSTDLSKMSALDRAAALHKLEEDVNDLSADDRRDWRLQGGWRDWFFKMTEEERGQFIDATLPTGFRQVINSFEALPEARRRKELDDAMRHLRETKQLPVDREPGQDTPAYGTNGPPPLSPDLEKKVRALGLKTFYGESSAQTKAELAPLVEELQHQLQSGRAFRQPVP